MNRKQAKMIEALSAALQNVNSAIEDFHNSGSMCEVTFDSLMTAKRNIEAEIVDAHAPRSKIDSNTLDLSHANAD